MKILKVLGISIGLFVLLITGLLYSIFGRQQRPRSGPALSHGIEQVADGIATIFILDPGNGKLVLIDAGNDPSGSPILEALQKRGKTASDVQAILITHAHPDHDAAVTVFPKAEVYAMQDEVAMAAGKEPYGSPVSKILSRFNPHPFQVTHPLHSGETFQIGSLNITAYEVSGHTPGSAVYLTQGVLFTGDAFNITKDLKIEGPVYFFSQNAPQAIHSLKVLLTTLSTRSAEIETISTSHTGSIAGAQGLTELGNYLADKP